jgi:hypothetical protein
VRICLSWLLRRIAGLLLATSATAASAQYLVLQSSGPSASRWTAGSRLPEDGSLDLVAGDRIVLLGRLGTRVLRGPGHFVPAQPPRPADLAMAQASVRRATAVSRQNIISAPPSIWHLDLRMLEAPDQASGKSTFCARGIGPIGIWNWIFRHVRFEEAEGHSPPLDWADNYAVLSWQPLGLANEFDAIAESDAFDRPRVLHVVRIAEPPDEPAVLLESLMRAGCLDQATRLRRRLVGSIDNLDISEGDLGWQSAQPDVLR